MSYYDEGGSGRWKLWVGLAVGVIVLLVLGAAIFVRYVGTAPDQVAIVYKGGAIQAKKFDRCIGTGSRELVGPGDTSYLYPANQRNYRFLEEGKERDTGPITFVTADGIEMSVTGSAQFYLVTDCPTLQRFHETIGNKTRAFFTSETESEGWTTEFLPVYLGQPLETAIDRAAQQFSYQDLYFDPAKKSEWEQAVVDLLPALVNRQTDGEDVFLNRFAVTLQKPEPPESVKAALVDQQAKVAEAQSREAEARAQEAAAAAQVAVAQQEAESAKAWIAILGVDGYLRWEALQQGQNPFQPGSAVVTQGQQ